jgi:hypothetical protein
VSRRCEIQHHRCALVRSAKTRPAVKAALKANTDIAITLFRKEAC